MMVASTIVPPDNLRPLAISNSPTLTNRAAPSLLSSSKCRKFDRLVVSGTRSRPRSMPQKSRNPPGGHTRLLHKPRQLGAMKYMRNMRPAQLAGVHCPPWGNKLQSPYKRRTKVSVVHPNMKFGLACQFAIGFNPAVAVCVVATGVSLISLMPLS